MKILRISLRNIASIAGTHTVDFTREPLRSSGLFSISGVTGSGKSTLLDALCLALYERTPRLNGVKGAVKLADGSHGDTITQKDPANLLRRGTGEGFAEVAFVGVDNAIYTARWTVRRSRSKADGALQKTEMALYRGNLSPGGEGPLEQGGRKGEVLPAIKDKLGLTFEQFSRAVMLAQNDFAAFLKAEDKDRAEILQALTGTERFEAISIRVYERHFAEQQGVGALEAQMAGNPPLSSELRAVALANYAEADTALKTVLAQLGAGEIRVAWFTRLGELNAAAGVAQSTLGAACGARDGAAPRRLELEHTREASRDARPLREAERLAIEAVADHEKSCAHAAAVRQGTGLALEAKRLQHAAAETARISVQTRFEQTRPQLLQARALDAKLVPVSERFEKARFERSTAEGALTSARNERDALQSRRVQQTTERAQLLLQLQALAGYADFAHDATAWLDRLDRAAAAGKTLEEAAARLAVLAADESEKVRLLTLERQNEPALRSAAEVACAALGLAEVAAKAHDAERIAVARSEAESTRSALQGLKIQLVGLQELASQAEVLRVEITRLETLTKGDTATLAGLRTTRLPVAEAALAGAREAHYQASAAVDAATVALREALRPDVPCPVCGAKEHPYSLHPPGVEAVALRALDSMVREKETLRDLLRAEQTRLEANLQSRASQIAEKTQTHTSILSRITAVQNVGHGHSEAVVILALPSQERLPALEARLAALEEIRRSLDLADTARRAAGKHRDDCRSAYETTARKLTELEKTLTRLDAALALAHAARESAQSAWKRASAESVALRQTHAPLFAGLPDAAAAFAGNAAAFRQSFASATAAFHQLESRHGELNRLIGEAEAALVPLEVSLGKAQLALAARQTEEAVAAADFHRLVTERKALFEGRAADAVEGELSAALSGAVRELTTRAGELVEAEKLHLGAEGAFHAAESALKQGLQSRATAGENLESWLAGFVARTGRALDRGGLDGLLARSELWFKAERAALEALESAVKTAEGALAVHQTTLAQHAAARPDGEDESTVTAALAGHRQAKEAATARCDETRAVLHADDQRIRQSAGLALELAALRAAAEPWSQLNELIGSADGAKFRGIAQRRTLDLLLSYANAQLELLAARYRLERLAESLNLIVIDREMADERRSVHSLSGGESFLVSLALALGLASLTSNRLRIESLFIDEGFGSLDPQTLDTVMSALMHLEAQGRKVGVISHVSEMTDAIPVQIRVVKGRSGASYLVVPGAPAASLPAVAPAAKPADMQKKAKSRKPKAES